MSRGIQIKEIEEFPRRLKIFFWVILILFIIGTLGFLIFDKSGIGNSFLRTLQTLSFVFEDNSSIPERLLEIFLAIVGVFLVWWVLWSVADMILDGNLNRYLKTRMYTIKLKKMNEHIIIAGGGRVGEEVAKVLSEKKQKFVIIDSSPEAISVLRKKNYLVLEGNAEHEEVLIIAGLKNAKKLIIALPKTEANVLITLTAKEINPDLEIYSICENSKYISKLKKAGAKVAIVPEIVAGDKLAESIGI